MFNKGFISKYMKNSYNSILKKPNNSFFKMGQRKHTSGQQAHENMLISHPGNQITWKSNHNEILSHICQNRGWIIKKTRNNQCWQDCEEREPLVPFGRTVNCWSQLFVAFHCLLENSMEIPKTATTTTTTMFKTIPYHLAVFLWSMAWVKAPT